MQEHILIVEDDDNISDGLKDILTGYGYRVSAAQNAEETFALLSGEKIHLIILDIHLEEENGYDICKKIRSFSLVPVLFLTGCSSEIELIRGFQVGGDDYVTKPFRMQELLVRIQALLRRSAASENPVCQSGSLSYNPLAFQVKKAGKVIELTTAETRILHALFQNWPRTLTREELFYAAWDKDSHFVDENTLTVNISRLREKLGTFDSAPYISTVRGIGYRWSVPVVRSVKI